MGKRRHHIQPDLISDTVNLSTQECIVLLFQAASAAPSKQAKEAKGTCYIVDPLQLFCAASYVFPNVLVNIFLYPIKFV